MTNLYYQLDVWYELLITYIEIKLEHTVKPGFQPRGPFEINASWKNGMYSTKNAALVIDEHFRHVSKSWEYFSGDENYPVPSTTLEIPNKLTPETMYFKTANKWVGEYGALRMDLLRHCIADCQIHIEQLKITKNV